MPNPRDDDSTGTTTPSAPKHNLGTPPKGRAPTPQRPNPEEDIASTAALVLASVAKVAGTLSALLTSGPTWFLLTLCGPYSEHRLWAPMAVAACLRLIFILFTLLSKGLEDGTLEPVEAAGALAAFCTRAAVTANALMPQPIFMTYVGGAFSSGDAS